MSVRIHRSDLLEPDYVTRHPVVKVHLVDVDTGEYLRTLSKESSTDRLLPLVTGEFDFRQKKSMVPVWEEELVFELDFKDLLVEGKGAVLILFEIVDLMSCAEAGFSSDQFGESTEFLASGLRSRI